MLKRAFYILAAILIVIWAVGFFIYALGALMHLLLIVAILLIAFRISRGSGRRKIENDRIKKYPRY
ncbi:MAG TPA: lmo0937 family membrane protein [Bacteroidales bacterium]|nr:lmo0937 family membrane protein [Bacteroidales bacterium]